MPVNALIVDDNAQNLYLLRVLLESQGFTVTEARNGRQALELLRREPFLVIISDILMPEMDGFQLCREVKADPELRHIPFLIYTATYTSAEDEAFARSLGADAFFVKPMEPVDFLAAVRAALARLGQEAPPAPMPPSEVDSIRQHNVLLVQKLERKVAQLQETNRDLRRSEDLFHTLAQAAPVGIFRVNAAGELDYVNDRWSAITGLSREAATLTAWQALIHPEERAQILDAWRQATGQGGVFQSEFRLRKPDGSVHWVLGQANPLAAEAGARLPYVGTFTDVTLRKKLEQERAEIQAKLHQSQKLEAIGTLVNGISHDFNNLVAAIFGYAESARRQIAKHEGAGADLEMVLRAAERAKSLTGQILRFSRQQTQELKPVRLGQVVRDALTLLRGSMPSNVHFKERIAQDLPPVLADATQIHQIVMNLVSNALYALRERAGELEVQLQTSHERPVLAVLDIAEGDYVILRVRDTGCGIAPEVLDRIFDPFFTTKPPEEGTGIGLSIVHGIVKGHGGTIGVASQPGQGTTVSVYLPALAETTPAAVAPPEGLSQGQGQRVLYVDNEQFLTALVKRMLELLGYRARVFTDSVDALEFVRRHPTDFDLLISDMEMPRLNGAELARRVWEVRPGVPVLFVSGAHQSLTRQAALHLGASDMLLKPFDMRALGEALTHALSGNVTNAP
jgi:PAS domain S-box-containing protein